MKKCTKCGEEKPLSEFSKNKRWADGLQKQCKTCFKLWYQKHYKENKQQYIDRNAEQRKATQELLYSLKVKCSRCPEDRPWCIDFHHTDPAEKEFTLGTLVGVSEERLTQELEKCIILCSNCHRDEHYRIKRGLA